MQFTDTSELTPAQKIEAMVTYAEWKAYEDERRLFMDERYRPIDGRMSVLIHGADQNGFPSGYKRGCKCVECKQAYNKYIREYRHKRGIHQPKKPFTHGTQYGYYVKHCHCAECEQWHKEFLGTPKPKKTFTHGTIYGFRVKKCTCVKCAAARAAYYPAKSTKEFKHGTQYAYEKRKCRCAECDAGYKRYLVRYNQKRALKRATKRA